MIYRGINIMIPRNLSMAHLAHTQPGVYLVGMNEADFERQRSRLEPKSLKRYPYLERTGTGPYMISYTQYNTHTLLYRLQ